MVTADRNFMANLIRSLYEETYIMTTIVVYVERGYVGKVRQMLEQMVRSGPDSDVELIVHGSHYKDFEGSRLSEFYKSCYQRARETKGPRLVPIYVTDNPKAEALQNARKQARLVFIDGRALVG